MDPETKKIVERARLRRQQLNEELSLEATKENLSGGFSTGKRKTVEDPCGSDQEVPSKKSSFSEKEYTDCATSHVTGLLKHSNFYPLDELENLAKSATNTETESTSLIQSHETIANETKDTYSSASDNLLDTKYDIVTSLDQIHEAASQEARRARMAKLSAKIESYDEDDTTSSVGSKGRNAMLKSFPQNDANAAKRIGLHSVFNRSPVKAYQKAPSTCKYGSPPTYRQRFASSDYSKNVEVRDDVEASKQKIAASRAAFFGFGSSTKSPSVFSTNVEQKTETEISHPVKFRSNDRTDDTLRPEQEIPVVERKSVWKLKNKWERASREGIPLHPDKSFSECDEITATALQMFQPKVPVPRKRTLTTKSEEIISENKLQTKTVVFADANFFERSSMPDVVISKESPPKSAMKRTYSENSGDVHSYTDNVTLNDSAAVSTDLDACLDEAINAATANAQVVVGHDDDDDDDKHVTSSSRMENRREFDRYSTPAHFCSPIKGVNDYNETTLNNTSALYYSALNEDLNVSRRQQKQDSDSTPLTYTVSMFRRLQKMKHEESANSTPNRTLILPPVDDFGDNYPGTSRRSYSLANRRQKTISDQGDAFLRAKQYDARVQKLTETIKIQQEQIYQATRLLNHCQHNEYRSIGSEIDAHRILLIAVERRKACRDELDRISDCRRHHKPWDADLEEPRGNLAISSISIMLRRDFVNDPLMSVCSNPVYHFICIVKYRDQLICTQIVDSDMAMQKNGRVEFSNYINLSVPHDFSVDVQVFALAMKKDDQSKESKFHFKTQTLRSKFKSMNSSGQTSLGGPSGVIDSNFKSLGQITVNLGSVARQKFALQGFNPLVPVEPSIELKMRCSVENIGNLQEKGFLSLYENIAGLAAWRRLWCCFKDGCLNFWLYPDDEPVKQPTSIIELSRVNTKFIEPVRSDICTRPNTFALELITDKNSIETRLLSTDDKEEFTIWSESINKALRILHLWSNVDRNHTTV